MGVSKQNRKSKMKVEMKKHRAVMGAWFKHVPVRFFCSVEIDDFQPLACGLYSISAQNGYENRPVDPGSIQGSHRPMSLFMRIKYRTRANDLP